LATASKEEALGGTTMNANPLRIFVMFVIITGALSAQTDLAAASTEMTSILADLERSIGSLERPAETDIGIPDFETSMQALTAVAARIDLFEARFGLRLEDVRGWAAVQEEARKALDPAKPSARVGTAYFAVSSSEMGKAILHEMAGDPDAALELLGKIRAGGSCGNWVATVNLSVNTRRSAILQRKGRFKDALAAHEAALGSVRYALHSKNLDALYVRHAILLERNERQPEAVKQYQRVVDLFPRTAADAIARTRLTTLGQLVGPTADRLSLYVGTDDRTEAILALGAHRFPESLDRLIALFQTPPRPGWVEDKIIEAIGILGDPKAVPFLRSCVADSAWHLVPALLVALNRLGDTTQVLSGLERLKGRDWVVGAGKLEEMLLTVHPRGPKVGKSQALRRTSQFAEAWIAYLTALAPSSRPS
jgi:tetratricopeptide (TPR) repeat protein